MFYRIVCDYGGNDKFYIERALSEDDARIKISIVRHYDDIASLEDCMDKNWVYYMETDE